MGSYRASRTEEDVKRELSDIMRSLKDPRITGLLSIVKLDLAKDLSSCKVYISSMDGLEAAKSAVKGLTSAAGFIKHELNSGSSCAGSPSSALWRTIRSPTARISPGC